MNDNSPCIVYSEEEGYSEVLPKSEAVSLAMELASKGQQVWVFKLADYLFYGGLT